MADNIEHFFLSTIVWQSKLIPIIEKKLLQGLIGSIGYCDLNTLTYKLYIQSVTTDLDINAATIVLLVNGGNAFHLDFATIKGHFLEDEFYILFKNGAFKIQYKNICHTFKATGLC